jgi:hypothetical protein
VKTAVIVHSVLVCYYLSVCRRNVRRRAAEVALQLSARLRRTLDPAQHSPQHLLVVIAHGLVLPGLASDVGLLLAERALDHRHLALDFPDLIPLAINAHLHEKGLPLRVEELSDPTHTLVAVRRSRCGQ